MHHLVRLTLDGQRSDEHLKALLRSWRVARTSELADTIEALGQATPVNQRSYELWVDEDAERWCEEAAQAAVGELAWLLAEFGAQAMNSWDLEDRRSAWRNFTRCVAALSTHEPDPRVGRAIEDALRGPGDYWFETELQERPRSNGCASFASLALPLLEVHGDAGSAKRLNEYAATLLEDADCNALDMSELLVDIAARLARAWPHDEDLEDEHLEAIRTVVR